MSPIKDGTFQRALFRDQQALYLPSFGTDATGRGIGPAWTRDGATGTVSHPVPATGFANEFLRTRITSTAAIDNELGVRLPIALVHRGNAASRGGFFFSSRFIVNAIPNNAIRFFAGLSSVAAGVCQANALTGDAVGLWCDATDAAALSLVQRENTLTTKTPLTTTTTLTAGTFYRFEIICDPGNQGTMVTRLFNEATDALIWTQHAYAEA